MNKTTKALLALLMFACLTLVVSGLWVAADPPPRPATFYGTVRVNGANPPSYVSVEAQIGGVTYKTAALTSSGADMVYVLKVPGENSEIAGKQGGSPGETVQFRVGGLLCAQTATWQEGGHTNLNLTASGTLPTATPTLTQVPSNTPTLTPTRTSTPRVTATPAVIDLSVTNTTVRDTYISLWYPNNNYGTGTDAHRLKVYKDAGRALLYFDTSLVPTNSTITRATLYLYQDAYNDGRGPTIVSLYRVLQPWADTQATWNMRLENTAWGAAGCSATGDREQTARATKLVEAAGKWYTWDILSLVQDWVWDPNSNKGMLLMGDNWHDMRFHSSDFTSNRPYLHIEYTAGTAPSLTPTTATPTRTPSTQPTSTVLEIKGANKDAQIDQAQPDTANLNGLKVYGLGQKRSLLDFDVVGAGVPANARIISATLRMTTSNYSDNHPERALFVGAYLVHKGWSENQATWRLARTGESWGASGCEAAPADRSDAPSSEVRVQAVSTGTKPHERVVYQWEVGPIVQAWLDDPTGTDGLILLSKSAMFRDIGFWDSSYMGSAGADLHPALVVSWEPGSAGPTPTATQQTNWGAVHGIVYLDANENGQRDAGETGMAGAQVRILIGSTQIGIVITDPTGEYTHPNLTQGSYTLDVIEPTGYRATSQDPRPIYVAAGETREEDFGVAVAMNSYLPLVLKGSGG
jgi:hypothetical protein